MGVGALVLWTFESEADAIVMELDDRKSVENFDVLLTVHLCIILSQRVHRPATYRCDDTRCCLIQFWPPDDDHIVLETCRGIQQTYYKTRVCTLSWLITTISRKVAHAVVVEGTLKMCSKSLCKFTWLAQTVSVSFKFNGIFVGFFV